ncbi:hypothetical protein HMPREF1705_04671 [Acetomicrobium hydrogeniformans ATCC BAA-1850]|uniref:Uncharacterized protein n=1 Tax=Acetomicrobium hydrogeniformans ATCC BAA-1850 TaxID=592015 RepID=A0A0T5XCU1_9BACT|nr:hypothetical protein HMPREF1705_04671 [Acetomicrobium hydrogeniformans ATCC BAA-1850]
MSKRHNRDHKGIIKSKVNGCCQRCPKAYRHTMNKELITARTIEKNSFP